MKNKKYNIRNELKLFCLVLFSVLLGIGSARAEGSKDLYPVNARGARASLALIPFGLYTGGALYEYPGLIKDNRGKHYVYAEAGEQIAIATDVQINGTERIFLYDPNGLQLQLSISGQTGNIPNRAAELAGPRLPGQAEGENRYLPIYYTVPPGGTGIYRVEFQSWENLSVFYHGVEPTAATMWPTVRANDVIFAWDVSVAKKTATSWNWVNGRVFTTILGLLNPITSLPQRGLGPSVGFYGKFKILTRDGFVYNLDYNGFQVATFSVTANNMGFSKNDQFREPSYKSFPHSTFQYFANRYGDPNAPEHQYNVYHKVFYNLPDSNMPEKARSALGGSETWLRVKEKKPTDSVDVKVISVGGVENQVGADGANIIFNTTSLSTYKIVIKPKNGSENSFPQRIIEGSSVIGENRVYWDGKDGAGNPLPNGIGTINIELKTNFGEIHIPYIGVAFNKEGMILELLSTNLQAVRSDKIYWDDSDIAPTTVYTNGGRTEPLNANNLVNPTGTSSRVNGRIWGLNGNILFPGYGYRLGLDTWAFAEKTSISGEVEVGAKVADLEIVSIVPDKTHLYLEDEIKYTVKVKNNGPSNVESSTFTFAIPQGFVPIDTEFFSNGCGAERERIVYNYVNQIYTSKLDLPNGCEISYEIRMRAINPMSGAIKVEAGILRPKDIYDPDATNQNGTPPIDIHYECENNGLNRPCNNIKENQAALYSDASFHLIKDGIFIDRNNDGFAQAGETIIYTLKLINTGTVKLSNIVLNDPLLGGIITEAPVKSLNSDNFLDINETWTYILTYMVTAVNINNRGVYNQANVEVNETIGGMTLEQTSRPTIPLTPTDPGYDPNRPNYTFVELKGNKVVITNPMVIQGIK